MTRGEAKELFEDNFTVINTHGHYTKEEEGQAQELAISALSAKDWRFYYNHGYAQAKRDLSKNKGEWIYDKGINNWRCSKCGQTPPPTGYVGNADFMATHFKFCNHCGADMRGDKAEEIKIGIVGGGYSLKHFPQSEDIKPTVESFKRTMDNIEKFLP